MNKNQFEKEKFLLEDFCEENREVVADYLCQLCKSICHKPILLGKYFINLN